MPHGIQGAVLRVLGAKQHTLTVRGITQLAPHFIRLHFHGTTLFEQASTAPSSWLRLWIIDPITEGEFQRAYTIAKADPSTGRVDIDFLLHKPAGPASAWAAIATPGHQIIAQFLGSTPFVLIPGTERLLLIGDAASLPAINTILGSIPHGIPIDVLLEQAHDADTLIPITEHPLATTYWAPRDGSTSLTAAARPLLTSNQQVWAAGETGSLKHLRSALRERHETPRNTTHVQAYWVDGRAMGTTRPAG